MGYVARDLPIGQLGGYSEYAEQLILKVLFPDLILPINQ